MDLRTIPGVLGAEDKALMNEALEKVKEDFVYKLDISSFTLSDQALGLSRREAEGAQIAAMLTSKRSWKLSGKSDCTLLYRRMDTETMP